MIVLKPLKLRYFTALTLQVYFYFPWIRWNQSFWSRLQKTAKTYKSPPDVWLFLLPAYPIIFSRARSSNICLRVFMFTSVHIQSLLICLPSRSWMDTGCYIHLILETFYNHKTSAQTLFPFILHSNPVIKNLCDILFVKLVLCNCILRI